MTLDIPDGFPIRPNGYGRYLVGETLLPLESIVYGLRAGCAPELIARSFDNLALGDVLAVQVYYLGHKAPVEAYLCWVDDQNKELRWLMEAKRVTRETNLKAHSWWVKSQIGI